MEERRTIAFLQKEGKSIRQIAASLDLAPSSVSREIKRNTGTGIKANYSPAYADEMAWARRWSGSKMERQPDLRLAVLNRLAMGWSPEQVAGRLALEKGKPIISHESVYRFIYAQIRRTNKLLGGFSCPKPSSNVGLEEEVMRHTSIASIKWELTSVKKL